MESGRDSRLVELKINYFKFMDGSKKRDPIISGPDSENDISFMTLNQYKDIKGLENPLSFEQLLSPDLSINFKKEFALLSDLTQDQKHFSLVSKRSQKLEEMNRYSDILPCSSI